MKTKRTLAMVITFCILHFAFCISPASAAVVEGTCGDNAKWKYDDTTNTLTIFGKGAMADYYLSSRPWSDYYSDVTTVVVERGITHIGGDSFYALTNLTTVTIADTVETIANRVFANCGKLTSIKLPDSVKSIGTNAFVRCSSLGEIKLPTSLKKIERYTFSNCSNLKSVIIPNSVESIETSAFEYCNSINFVHYSGTRNEWNLLTKYLNTSFINSGTRHYCTETSWKAATCTKEGQEGGIYCTPCQKYVKEPNVIPINPDNHSFKNGICSRCEAYEEPEIKDNYYQIENAGQLYWFANHINNNDRTANAVLVADIDLEGKSDGTGRKWTPIGSTGENSNNFRGHFDGRNHTITNLYIDMQRAGLGLFGEVRLGTVENFTIYGDVKLTSDCSYVGGVIGSAPGANGTDVPNHNGATIRNITSYVNVTLGDGSHGSSFVGGFMGYANHETIIENCSWYGTLDLGANRADSGVGGLVGRLYDGSDVTIRNCGAYGTIKTSYKSGTHNNYDTIYIGGVLSFSPAGTQAVLENNLWAGNFINDTDLGNKAHLSAFGTLNGEEVVTNCYTIDSAPYLTTENVNANGIISVTEQQLASGEVAYLLQGEQTTDVWGQDLSKENSLPVLGGDKVYLNNGIYYNEVKVFEILSNGTNGTKATATVAIPTAGTYTLIFADYEETRLNNMDLVAVTAESDNTVVNVPSEIGIAPGKDDKIMLWQDMTNLVPLCEAYIVK